MSVAVLEELRIRSGKQGTKNLVWLGETAKRVHGTYPEQAEIRFVQKKGYLGKWPPMDYDTSIKV